MSKLPDGMMKVKCMNCDFTFIVASTDGYWLCPMCKYDNKGKTNVRPNGKGNKGK